MSLVVVLPAHKCSRVPMDTNNTAPTAAKDDPKINSKTKMLPVLCSSSIQRHFASGVVIKLAAFILKLLTTNKHTHLLVTYR